MTDSTGLKLRALLAATKRGEAGRGYPRHLREKASRCVRSRREQGATYEQIAATLGVPPSTLHRWSRRLGTVTTAAVADTCRRVELAAAAPTVTLHGPCGLRIEGLDLDTLVALWRRLAS